MKSNYDVARAFADGLTLRNRNLSSDGEWLTSYSTRVARRDTKNHVIWITSTKYSVTTSRQLSYIPTRPGYMQCQTDSLNNPVEGAAAHIYAAAEKYLAKRPHIRNLGWQLSEVDWFNKQLEMFGAMADKSFTPIVPPLALLQRCAKHNVPVDFKLWALAHGKAE